MIPQTAARIPNSLPIAWAGQVIDRLDRVPYCVLAVPLRIAVAAVFWNSAMSTP